MIQLKKFVFGSFPKCHFSISVGVNRLRSEWRRDRKPANTKLGDDNIQETRKAYGGRSKAKAKFVSNGQYSLQSQNIEQNLKILDVIHSDAGKHYRENRIISKGTIVAVDGTNFKSELDMAVLYGDNDVTPEIKEHVEKFFEEGKLYAKVTSRPGQVGTCDGHILEGSELINTIDKLRKQNIC